MIFTCHEVLFWFVLAIKKRKNHSCLWVVQKQAGTRGQSLVRPSLDKGERARCFACCAHSIGHSARTTGVPRSSEEQLSRAYHLLMAQLSQDHAEIRLSAFQAIDELFARSHQFRMLVVSNFQEFLELTLGTDHEQPLPPPREVAQRLRQAATRAIQGWNEKYGAAYKKLALGYHFLRHSKQVGRPHSAALVDRLVWPQQPASVQGQWGGLPGAGQQLWEEDVWRELGLWS